MIGTRLSHYRIVEQIGRGGMGVVYRAHDEHLDRDVAIKVLPHGSLSDEAARKRFRTEALSLARLNHPNVATVHEFGSQDGVDFLVTEYIAGQTLDTVLARGALPASEVVRLGVQLAEGLGAAHEHGVVHRDLKPANLRLTSDGRLKILDFGLAQFTPRASEAGQTATVTQTLDVIGTLPYMAPEQLSGEQPDARTDIWSAGAVLYEMASGKPPFEGKTQPLLVNAILSQPLQPPGDFNSGITAELDEIILKALTRDRARRYQSAVGLKIDLARPTTITGGLVPVPRPRRSRWRTWATIAVVIGSICGYIVVRRAPRSALQPEGNRRRSVAVVGFKNLSGNTEKAWLSTALSEMLTTDLSQGNQLRTVPGESVELMKASLSLANQDSFSRATLGRIRENLGSDVVIVGSYLPLGEGQLRVDLRLQDTVSGETLVAISEKGRESEIDQLVGKAGSELRSRLGVEALSGEQSALVRASLPSNPEAARLYAEGLQRLRTFDALKARESLEQAVVLDPDHAPTHSALAEAWSVLGYESKAKEQARRALELSAKFSREERLLIEGRAHELLSETPQAMQSYQSLWEFFPDNANYGFSLIRTQIATGHATEAQATLAALRRLNLSAADSARVDLTQASIASSMSDFKTEQMLAERAAQEGSAVGANLVAAQAFQLEADAWERMGQSEKTIQLSNHSRELYLAAGDRRGAARSLLAVGDLLFDEGDYDGALKQFNDAIPVFREIGAQKNVRATLERIGNVFYATGKLREAKDNYEQAMRFDQEINDPFGLASDYGNLANALDGLGDLPGTLKMQQQSLSTFNQIGDRRGASATLNNLGNLFVEMGDLPKARRYYDQALSLSREISYRRGEPYPMSGIGDTLLMQGDLPGARKQYEQALSLCQELKDEDFSDQLRGSLATVALAEKRYADGEALARQAAEGYEKNNSKANEAWALAVLARNLLGAGKVPDAEHASSKAADLVKQSAGLTPRYEVALANARVLAQTGKSLQGQKELKDTLASTRKFGYHLYEYQTRLALCELETGSAARSCFGDLERDAKTQGALLVANQAHALAAPRAPH